MGKKLIFLGIETSCDETAASIVQENLDGSANVLSSIVSSQIKEHEKFGGVVPELAARSDIENIDFIISKALRDAKTNLDQIDGVAATATMYDESLVQQGYMGMILISIGLLFASGLLWKLMDRRWGKTHFIN